MPSRSESINWPKLEFTLLKNGTKCVLAPLAHSSLLCFDFWFKAGSALERKGEEGLAHFIEHMLFKGSKNLKMGEFDKRIEELGGSSNAATGFDDVHFHVLVPPIFAIEALKLLSDLVFRPSFNTNEFKVEREVVLEEIAQYKDQPDEVIFQKLLNNCWGDHPYGRTILGVEESLISSTTEQMRLFHKNHYIPQNSCLAISGPVTYETRSYIDDIFSSETQLRTSNSSNINPSRKLSFRKGHEIIRVPRLETARILMAWPIPEAKKQLIIMGCDIATSLLAQGRRSLFVNRLREELQIVEYIDMDITILEEGGLILLEAYCMKEKIEIVEKEIYRLLKHSIETPFSESEINRACKLVENNFIFSLETPNQLAYLAGNKGLWNRQEPLEDQSNYIKHWNRLKLENIMNLMDPDLVNTLIAIPEVNI